MKTVDFERDQLTHQLMAGTTERPTSSMNARIMAILMKEKRKMYVYTVRFWLTPGGLLTGLAVYLLIVGSLIFWGSQWVKETLTTDLPAHAQLFPVLITLCSGLAFFVFFVQLDKWLRWRAKRAYSHKGDL